MKINCWITVHQTIPDQFWRRSYLAWVCQIKKIPDQFTRGINTNSLNPKIEKLMETNYGQNSWHNYLKAYWNKDRGRDKKNCGELGNVDCGRKWCLVLEPVSRDAICAARQPPPRNRWPATTQKAFVASQSAVFGCAFSPVPPPPAPGPEKRNKTRRFWPRHSTPRGISDEADKKIIHKKGKTRRGRGKKRKDRGSSLAILLQRSFSFIFFSPYPSLLHYTIFFSFPHWW